MQHMGITVRKIAELIGTLVLCCVAIQFGFVYTKLLEQDYSAALNGINGNFDQKNVLNTYSN
jgi:hypothetical protein